MSALRITGNRDRLSARVERKFYSRSTLGAPGASVRVLATRGGLGERNARFRVGVGEGPAGRVNPTSDGHGSYCTESGELPAGGYVTATRRDSFDSEREATSGDTSTHTAALLDSEHAFQLRRNIASLTY